MKYRIFIMLIAGLLIAANYSQAEENSVDNPVIDSALTLEKALAELSPNCPDEIRKNQVLVDVLYYSVEGMIHRGQVVVDHRLEKDIKKVFKAALKSKFPIELVTPVSDFMWSDEDSMAENNTSAFNYREVTGGKKLSNHAYGFAIDINPFFNPYIKEEVTLPADAVYDPQVPGTLTEDHIVVKTFLELGWEWGGNWESLKDYQHFEKVLNE